MAVSVKMKDRILFFKEPTNSLIKNLMKQRASGEFCDVNLIVNGRRFPTHKAVLACNSPYFHSMFSSRMTEEYSNEINMTQSFMLDTCDSFSRVLDYMYSGEIYLDIENSIDVLRISDFLLMDDLKEFVKEYFLANGHLNIANAIFLWEASGQFNETDIHTVSSAMLRSRFHDFYVHSSELLTIPEELFFKMLSKQSIQEFTKTKDCLDLVLQWMRCNCYTGKGVSQYIEKLDLESLEIITLEEIKFMLRDTQSSIALSKVKRALQAKLVAPPSHKIEQREVKSTKENKLKDVLIAVNSQIPQRYLKILLFDIGGNSWRQLQINCEKIIHRVPSRLNACSVIFQDSRLHMFLGFNVPYPTDMLRIQMLVLDIRSGEHWILTFRHRYNQTECCQTTLTDDRSVPPAICYCNGYLCVIGNMRGTGQIYLCDVLTQTYLCYQIPSARFISLARVVSRNDRQIYVWCRHRFGHEEYCVNKEVTFCTFDVRTKSFNSVEIPSPPGIDYGHFADSHILCMEDDHVVVHSPGKNSYVLNETLSLWKVYSKKIDRIPKDKMPVQMPYQGCEVHCYNGGEVYTLQNPAAYITSAVAQSPGNTRYLPPPPADGISLLASGSVESGYLQKLKQITRFDERFTQMIHRRVGLLDYSTETSMCSTGHQRNPDSDFDFESGDDLEYDGFVYDEDIYGLYEEY